MYYNTIRVLKGLLLLLVYNLTAVSPLVLMGNKTSISLYFNHDTTGTGILGNIRPFCQLCYDDKCC